MQLTQPAHIIRINDWHWSAPTTIDQCCLCLNGVGQVTICEPGHTICQLCFEKDYDKLRGMCPQCKEKNLYERQKVMMVSSIINTRLLNNTTFYCNFNHCNTPVQFTDLDNHRDQCPQIEKDCDYDCGVTLPQGIIDTHKLECRKRPFKEGNLEADFETVTRVKELKSECEIMQSQELAPAQKIGLFDRMFPLFPLVAEAALKTVETPASTTQNVYCQYQCGYIAGAQGEQQDHSVTCPNKPVRCRHCSKSIMQKILVEHEEGCVERPVKCNFCKTDTPWNLRNYHKDDCPNYPVSCSLCNNSVSRMHLNMHNEFECPERSVRCRHCFETTVAKKLEVHKQTCRFLQPIILGKNTGNPVSLVPQHVANGPFYVEEGSDTTVYLATYQKVLRSFHNRHLLFYFNFHLQFAGYNASLYSECNFEGQIKVQLLPDAKDLAARFEFIDADNNPIIAMYDSKNDQSDVVKPSALSAGCSIMMRAKLEKEESKKLLSYKHSDDLRLLKIKAVTE